MLVTGASESYRCELFLRGTECGHDRTALLMLIDKKPAATQSREPEILRRDASLMPAWRCPVRTSWFCFASLLRLSAIFLCVFVFGGLVQAHGQQNPLGDVHVTPPPPEPSKE